MPQFKVTLELSTYVTAEVEANSYQEAEEKLSQGIEIVKDKNNHSIKDFERGGIITRLYEIYEEKELVVENNLKSKAKINAFTEKESD